MPNFQTLIPCPLHGKAHEVSIEPHPTNRDLVIAKCGERVVLQALASISKPELMKILGLTKNKE